ncbi:MFS transporter [Pseudochelatococcus sp. B33]
MSAGKGVDSRIWLLALGAFATGTDAQIVAGILPHLARDLSVGLGTAGMAVGVYSVAYALSAPILAALTVQFRRDRVAVASLAAFTLANALCAVAPSFTVLVIARVLAGIFGGLFIPAAYALAGEFAPAEQKGAALGRVAVGITGAIVAGVPLGAWVGANLGWQGAFWLVTAISAAAVAAIAIWIPAPGAAKAPATLLGRFKPLVHPAILIALLPTLLCLSLNGGVYTYLGALVLAHGYPTSMVLIAFFSFGLGALVSSQTAGRIIDRFGPIPPMVLALFVGVGVALVFPAAMSAAWSTCLASFALGAAPWPVVLGQQRRLMSLAPEHVEVVLALNNSFVYFGVAAGATFGSILLERGFGLDAIPAFGGAFPAAALLALIASEAFNRRREEKDRN